MNPFKIKVPGWLFVVIVFTAIGIAYIPIGLTLNYCRHIGYEPFHDLKYLLSW